MKLQMDLYSWFKQRRVTMKSSLVYFCSLSSCSQSWQCTHEDARTLSIGLLQASKDLYTYVQAAGRIIRRPVYDGHYSPPHLICIIFKLFLRLIHTYNEINKINGNNSNKKYIYIQPVRPVQDQCTWQLNVQRMSKETVKRYNSLFIILAVIRGIFNHSSTR